MIKRIFSSLLVAAIMLTSLLTFVGCGDGANYPVTVAGVRIEKRPETIICLSPSYTGVIADMGYASLLDGRTADCTLAAVQSLPAVGSSDSPAVDLIVDMGADLVICDTTSPVESLEQLANAGIVVLQLLRPSTRTAFSNLYRCIGTAMNGAEDGYQDGDAAAKDILVQLDDIERLVMSDIVMNVCIFTSSTLNECITGDNLATMLIELAGGFNIAIEGVNGYLDLDSIALSDPDIILCPEGCAGVVRSKRDLEDCSALINNRVYVYDTSKFNSLGSDLVTATWELARLIHPDIVTAEMLPAGAIDYIPNYDDAVMNGDEYEAYLSSQAAATATTTTAKG